VESGDLAFRVGDGPTGRDLDRPGTCVVAASLPSRLSQENGGLQRGVFTYCLVEGLTGPADGNGDGKITVREAFDYTRREVLNRTGNAQEPYLLHNLSGDCYLRR